MKINNKFINKIVAENIVKHFDEYEVEYVTLYGFTIQDLKKWLGVMFANGLYSFYSKHPLIEWILKSLCEAEMELKLVADKNFRYDLDTADVGGGGENHDKSDAMLNIPEHTFYCEGCPYGDRSELARFLFGYQSCGYCYYLGKGDFSFNRPTDLLWDGCKCCGINEDIDEEDV